MYVAVCVWVCRERPTLSPRFPAFLHLPQSRVFHSPIEQIFTPNLASYSSIPQMPDVNLILFCLFVAPGGSVYRVLVYSAQMVDRGHNLHITRIEPYM